MSEFRNLLKKNLTKYLLDLSSFQVEQLEQHYELMLKWNKTTNLTRIVSAEESAKRHYVDSLLGFKLIESGKVIDMGSGAGFPGLVGAIAYPEKEILLIEAAEKRCSFLRAAKNLLGLKNLNIRHERAENCWGLQAVVSRATFSEAFFKLIVASLAPEGNLFLWSSNIEKSYWVKQAGKHQCDFIAMHKYNITGLPERAVVNFRKHED